jgi:hypothetical protein
MTPLGVKTCGKFEFEIFEANSGKAHCVSKRKVAKMRFLPKNDPFWGKNVHKYSTGKKLDPWQKTIV